MYNPVLLFLRTCTGIQNPFLNMNLLGLQNNLSAKYMSNASESYNSPNKVQNIGDWIGGKPDGQLKFDTKNLIIKQGEFVQKVPLSKFASKQEAEIHGKNLLYSLCKTSGKVLNEYRHVKDDSESFLEVKVDGVVIRVDDQAKELIENFVWLYDTSEKVVFRKAGNKKIKLEADLFKVKDSKLMFDKQDGNDFNYRLKNLQMLSIEVKKKK